MYEAARAARIADRRRQHHPLQHRHAPTRTRGCTPINDWIRGYVASHGTGMVFCDTRAAVAAPGQPDRLVSSPDDLHPSPEGYKLMADAPRTGRSAIALAKARCIALS